MTELWTNEEGEYEEDEDKEDERISKDFSFFDTFLSTVKSIY